MNKINKMDTKTTYITEILEKISNEKKKKRDEKCYEVQQIVKNIYKQIKLQNDLKN